MNDITSLGEIVAGWAKSQPLVEKAWLFGSRVRGEERPDSDLDVALTIRRAESDDTPDVTWTHEAESMRESLQALLPFTLHLQWYGGEKESPVIHKALCRSSTLVYEGRA